MSAIIIADNSERARLASKGMAGARPRRWQYWAAGACAADHSSETRPHAHAPYAPDASSVHLVADAVNAHGSLPRTTSRFAFKLSER